MGCTIVLVGARLDDMNVTPEISGARKDVTDVIVRERTRATRRTGTSQTSLPSLVSGVCSRCVYSRQHSLSESMI